MSYEKDGQVHIEDDDAMAATSTGHLRWILLISLLATIIILSAIWIFGAWDMSNPEPATATVTEVSE